MLVQLSFKNSMSYWFPMYMSLQLICYLVIFNYLPIPANTSIFIQEFTKAIEFESLNPVGVVRFFNPDFELDRWIDGRDENEVVTNPDQTATLFRDLRMIVILGISFFAVLIIMKLISFLSKKHRRYINEAITGVLQRFFFNGYLGSMMLGYIKLNIAVKV